MKTCGQCSIHYPDVLEFCPRDGTRLPAPAGGTQELYDPLIGSTIDGRYIVEALLGQGGMGFVYAARHAIIDKRVAIKVLRKEAAQDEASSQRFLVEAKAASKIGHQNIVDITDFGVLADGHAFFVMEFLDGPTLAKLVVDNGHLAPLRAIAIATQIARGLHAAHGKGIIHRDLKPENVFVLERDGQHDLVKIVDFGIAKDKASGKKLTQVGMVLGTPEYMSPEQATGQATDHRVDMYALGCIMYEMLVGDVPFKGENSTKTLTKQVFDPVVPPTERRPELGIPAALEAVVMRALQKKPAARFADLRAMMDELDHVEADLRAGKLGAAPPVDLEKLRQTQIVTSEEELVPSRSRTGIFLAVGAAAVVALAGLALTAGHGTRPVAKPLPVVKPLTTIMPVTTPLPPVPAPATALTAQIELVLRTLPPGADVFEGPERLGVSPLILRRARADAAISFTFRRSGFKETSREVTPDRDRDVEVGLTAKEAAPKPAKLAVSPRRPTNGSSPNTTPKPPGQPKRVSNLRNPFE